MKHCSVIAIAASTLLLSACGSDGSDSSESVVIEEPPVTDPLPPVTETPVPEEPTTCYNASVGESCILSGTYNEDLTLRAGVNYVIDGFVRIGRGNINLSSTSDVAAAQNDGVTLTVEPGSHIRAASDGALVITRGSRIIAEGTAQNPITFSSLEDDDLDGMGEWGGLIIQGFAPAYGQGDTGVCYNSDGICNVLGEGGNGIGYYGGNLPADSSGVLKYVRIAEAAMVADPSNEINGLTLMGVGHGTTIDYVQVHNNLDDGIEWFGGTVNASHLVLTGNDDDDIDFDNGYQGNIQYALVVKNADRANPTGSNDPRGIEANSSDDEYVPQTEAALANITLVGAQMTAGQYAMRLRGAVTSRIYNTAMVNWENCIRIDDADTDGRGTMAYSNITLANVVGDCADSFYTARAADTTAGVTGLIDIDLDDAGALTAANGNLASATAMTTVDNGSGFVFDNTSYIGAVAPGTTAEQAWWASWVIEGSLDNIANQDDAAVTFAGN